MSYTAWVMSRWSAKLEAVSAEGLRRSARVGQERPTDDSAIETAAESVDRTAIDSGPRSSSSESQELASPQGPRLDDLQKRLARLLGNALGASPSAPNPSTPSFEAEGVQTLDFSCESTEFGQVRVRRQPHRASRVGRIAVTRCSVPSMAMIALLALDPALEAIEPRSVLYFDLETTGLSTAAGTVAFLVGLGFFEDGGATFVVEQLLLGEMDGEKAMLARVLDRLQRASLVVSYNGKAFDLPLIKTRCVMNRLPLPSVAAHLDLVHVARRIHGHRLPSRSLATIETEVLGFQREGDIPSAEIPARYFHYLRTGDEKGLVPVVNHNVWDVLTMAALMGIYGEPIEGLGPTDLVGVARTLRRARSFELAKQVIDRAVASGAGSSAIRTRAEIAKARGDKIQALADFESLLDQVDDPKIRLALAKLYEHHARDPLSALDMLARGTGERREELEHRKQRLLRKARNMGNSGGGERS